MTTDWTLNANCRGLDPAMFVFPEDARTKRGAAKTARARTICRDCPVRAECLAYAMSVDVQGVWAGTTYRQRRQMLRVGARGARGPIPHPQGWTGHEHGTRRGYDNHIYYGTKPCDACHESAQATWRARRAGQRAKAS